MDGHILVKSIDEEEEKIHVKKCFRQKKDKSKTTDQEAGLIKLYEGGFEGKEFSLHIDIAYKTMASYQ